MDHDPDDWTPPPPDASKRNTNWVWLAIGITVGAAILLRELVRVLT